MSEPVGLTVLRRVADHYDTHPDSWGTGPGALHAFAKKNNQETIVAELGKSTQGCIHTMIRAQSFLVADDDAAESAEKDAIRILCKHHGLEVKEGSIFKFNDEECKSAKNAVKFVKAVFQKTPAPVPISRQIAGPNRAVSSVTSIALAVLIASQVLLGSFA